MASIYLLYLCFFPIAILCKTKLKINRDNVQALITKNDSLFLRGVSACFVVMAHFIVWIYESYDEINIVFYLIMKQLGGIGVLIFFFVSGYGIHKSYAYKPPNWDYLWRRAKNVYFPYLITKLLLIIIDIAITKKITFGINTIVSIILVEDWFVHVILIQYILFFVMWKFLDNKHMILFSVLFDVLLSCVYIIEGKPDSWFNALWLFTFGIACSQYEEKICKFFEKEVWIKSFFLIGLFGVTGIIFAINKGNYWANPLKTGGGVFLCLAICGILQKLKFDSKSAIYLGKRSMYIYIVHVNIWFILEVHNMVYKFWIILLLTLIFSEIAYQLTEFLMRNGKKLFNRGYLV